MKEGDVPNCEAGVHHKRFVNGEAHPGNTIDHFTPRCIGKALGWTPQEINAADNLIPTNRWCHIMKDSDTPVRKRVLQRQLAGDVISFNRHMRIFQREERLR